MRVAALAIRLRCQDCRHRTARIDSVARLRAQAFIGVYPGFPTLFWGLSWFFVDDLMGKALWKLAENAQRFPRCGGRVLCVHGAGSFHRAHPYATRSPRPRTAVDP